MKFMLPLIILLSSCTGIDSYECPDEDTNSWNGYHWNSNVERIEIVDMTGNINYLVEEVTNDWNEIGIPMELVYTHEETNKMPTITVEQQIGDGWLGLASINISPELHIKRGRVYISPLTLPMSDYAIKHVMCQEMGHALGLSHILYETCMDDCSWASGQEWQDCINDPEKSVPSLQDSCQLERLIHDD